MRWRAGRGGGGWSRASLGAGSVLPGERGGARTPGASEWRAGGRTERPAVEWAPRAGLGARAAPDLRSVAGGSILVGAGRRRHGEPAPGMTAAYLVSRPAAGPALGGRPT